MQFCRYGTVLAFLGSMAACGSVDGPVETNLAGAYHPVAYRLVLYDVLESPPGTEFTLMLNADSSFSGRLWFPAPWAPFWGDTSSYELPLAGTWERGPGQLPALPGVYNIPTDSGPGVYLHPAQPSFMQNAFLRARHDTLYLRVQTWDEPGPINDIYFDAVMVRD